jgi:hypothetical protein
MQTFLPEYSFTASARALDNKRLGKQRVETLQLLQAIARGPTRIKSKNGVDKVVKTPWRNHPACKMWLGFESQLIRYGQIICKEWQSRGFRDTCYEKISALQEIIFNKEELEDISYTDRELMENAGGITDEEIEDSIIHPHWYTKELVESHRSNLIRKNSEFYKPKWPETIEGLEYWWPVPTP